MKKIILLIVSGLLIASMAGSAMAGQITLGLTGDQIIYLNPSGSTVDVDLTYTGMDLTAPHTASVSTTTTGSVSNPKLDASIINLPGGVSTLVANAGGAPATTVYTPPGSNPYTAKLRVTGNSPGVIQILDSETGFPLLTVQVFIRTNIPEFPTVALPVAGVLGLLFVFGRKKEGL